MIDLYKGSNEIFFFFVRLNCLGILYFGKCEPFSNGSAYCTTINPARRNHISHIFYNTPKRNGCSSVSHHSYAIIISYTSKQIRKNVRRNVSNCSIRHSSVRDDKIKRYPLNNRNHIVRFEIIKNYKMKAVEKSSYKKIHHQPIFRIGALFFFSVRFGRGAQSSIGVGMSIFYFYHFFFFYSHFGSYFSQFSSFFCSVSNTFLSSAQLFFTRISIFNYGYKKNHTQTHTVISEKKIDRNLTFCQMNINASDENRPQCETVSCVHFALVVRSVKIVHKNLM